jgi:FMN phosphatase YigB (HAD superfamily)
MVTHSNIEALLFDLGGVVIGIDWERVFQRWAEHSPLSPYEIRERFKMDTAYEQHERGELSEAAYFTHLRTLLEFEGDNEQLRHGWNALFIGEIEETVTLIRSLKSKIPIYLLSNSNPTHEAFWRRSYPEAIELFTDIFVSSTLGCRKPERAVFEAIARETGVELASILFFDDTVENIEGARAAGLKAVQVNEPSDVSRVLARMREDL